MSGMAGSAAHLFNFEDHRIVIAVDANFAYALNVSGRLAFHPEAFPAAAVVSGPSAGESRVPGRFVHEGEHQDLAGLMILSDRGNQAAKFVKVEREHAGLPLRRERESRGPNIEVEKVRTYY